MKTRHQASALYGGLRIRIQYIEESFELRRFCTLCPVQRDVHATCSNDFSHATRQGPNGDECNPFDIRAFDLSQRFTFANCRLSVSSTRRLNQCTKRKSRLDISLIFTNENALRTVYFPCLL